MKKATVIIIVLFICVMCVGVYAEKTANDLQNDVLRLHIVANSDSYDDQNAKLMLRDRLLPIFADITKYATSRDEAKSSIIAQSEEIEAIAESELKNYGFSDSVSISVEERSFPTKEYGDYALPNGEYISVTVTLGKGEGKNFWCLIYPEAYSGVIEEIDESELSDEEKELISEKDGKYIIKFRIVELWGRLKEWIFGK